MKISDFLFLHHNSSSISGYSIFRFRLFSNRNHLYAVISNLFVPERLGGPFGQSITNSIESVVDQLAHEGFICSNSTRIILSTMRIIYFITELTIMSLTSSNSIVPKAQIGARCLLKKFLAYWIAIIPNLQTLLLRTMRSKINL